MGMKDPACARLLPQQCPSTQRLKARAWGLVWGPSSGATGGGFPSGARAEGGEEGGLAPSVLGHPPRHSLRLLHANRRLFLGAQRKDSGFGVASLESPKKHLGTSRR